MRLNIRFDLSWVELGWFFFLFFFTFYRIRVIILTPRIHQNLRVYRRSFTNTLSTDSKRGKFNLYRINIKSIYPRGLIKKMGFCFFYSYPRKKKSDWIHWNTLLFLVLYSERSPCERTYGNDFNQATGSDQFQSTNNTIIRKKTIQLFFICIWIFFIVLVCFSFKNIIFIFYFLMNIIKLIK